MVKLADSSGFFKSSSTKLKHSLNSSGNSINCSFNDSNMMHGGANGITLTRDQFGANPPQFINHAQFVDAYV
jgi:hypothetical protein